MAYWEHAQRGLGAMEPIRAVRLNALLSVRNEEIPEHTSDNP
jgi:hypothetical protein